MSRSSTRATHARFVGRQGLWSNANLLGDIVPTRDWRSSRDLELRPLRRSMTIPRVPSPHRDKCLRASWRRCTGRRQVQRPLMKSTLSRCRTTRCDFFLIKRMKSIANKLNLPLWSDKTCLTLCLIDRVKRHGLRARSDIRPLGSRRSSFFNCPRPCRGGLSRHGLLQSMIRLGDILSVSGRQAPMPLWKSRVRPQLKSDLIKISSGPKHTNECYPTR